jgi:phage terminase large subunit-like protein
MLASTSVEQLKTAREHLIAERERILAENRLAHYDPYPKQRDFHEAGARCRERLLMAANQVGKTWAGGSEAAMHATGRYPDWWRGKRFDKPTVAWVAGVTGESTRDNPQRILLGREGKHGTGTIPKDAIADVIPARSSAPGLADTMMVKHVSGGVSQIGLKSYEKGREKWQGETLDWVWFDEEPPSDIYTEGMTRTNVGEGPVFITFTPLLGMSEVVRRYLNEPSPQRHVTNMTIEDAEHFSPEERARIIASYLPHERDARIKGIPQLGSGRIFPVSEELIACDRRDIPKYWPRLGAMDFGWDHPFAAVELAWDRDHDTVYVTRAYRIREATPVIHAAALKPWGKLLWAWPRDGGRETLEGAGIALAEQYRKLELDMLYMHAQFEPEPGKTAGGISVEAGLMEMLTRMETGRFKVFRDLEDWFQEFRLYHRKDGKVVKEGDDLMSATRYGVMMLRFARSVAAHNRFNRDLVYPPMSYA